MGKFVTLLAGVMASLLLVRCELVQTSGCATGDPACDPASALLQLVGFFELPPNFLFLDSDALQTESYRMESGGALDLAPRSVMTHSYFGVAMASDGLRSSVYLADSGSAVPNLFSWGVGEDGSMGSHGGFPLDMGYAPLAIDTDLATGQVYVALNNGTGSVIYTYGGSGVVGNNPVGDASMYVSNMVVDSAGPALFVIFGNGNTIYRYPITNSTVNQAVYTTPSVLPAAAATKTLDVHPSGNFAILGTDSLTATENLLVYPVDQVSGALGNPIVYVLDGTLSHQVMDTELSPAGDRLYVLASTQVDGTAIFAYDMDSVTGALTLRGVSPHYNDPSVTLNSIELDGGTGSLYLVGDYLDVTESVHVTVRGFSGGEGLFTEAPGSPFERSIDGYLMVTETLY